MSTVPAVEPAIQARRYRWVVALIALAGFALVNMDSSFFTGSYLDIMKALHFSASDIGYLYAISYAVGGILALFIGSWADSIGRKRTFQIAMVGVALGSLLSGVAWGFASLLVFRALSQASASSEPVLGQTFVTEEVNRNTADCGWLFNRKDIRLVGF